MSNYIFEIQLPNDNFLRTLNALLHDDGFKIFETSHDDFPPIYYFKSAYIKDLSAAVAYDQARQLALFIDGISFLLYEDRSLVRKMVLGNIRGEDFKIVPLVKPKITNGIAIDWNIYKATSSKNDNDVIALLKLVPTDNFIRDLLLNISRGMDYVDLYNILDSVKTFLKKRKSSLEKLGFTENEIDYFIHTANNSTALGNKARHGNRNWIPPEIPMPIDEAQKLFTRIIFSVLLNFYSINPQSHVIKYPSFDADNLFD